jgi:hypothetical protein
MKVGLAGFPGSGKSTVFSALTGLPPVAPGERRTQIGTIKVPDERVDALAEIYKPKKVTYSETTFLDFPPAKDAQKRGVLDEEAVTALRDADALVEVVRGFTDMTGAAPVRSGKPRTTSTSASASRSAVTASSSRTPCFCVSLAGGKSRKVVSEYVIFFGW